MAEEITKYVVSIGFDTAIKNLNNFTKKMAKMEKGRESALMRQIKLQRQLNSLRGNVSGQGVSGGRGVVSVLYLLQQSLQHLLQDPQ